MIFKIDGFKQKLFLFEKDLNEKQLQFFPCLKSVYEEDLSDISMFNDYVRELKDEFHKRFTDFEKIRKLVPLFLNPMTCDIQLQPSELQLELCDVQTNLNLLTDTYDSIFWKKNT